MKKQDKNILIVGAGPSGLAAAVFLSERGFHPRIIDKLSEHTNHSKAFGVNPNTLSLFESSGITQRFLNNGRKCEAFNFWHWKSSKLVFRNDLTKINNKYPFVLVQSQADSERILREEIERRNILLERNVSFDDLSFLNGKANVKLKKENSLEDYSADYIIGADGAHSDVRKKLGIDFGGHKYDKEWELYDMELEMPFNNNEAHFFVKEDGGLFMVCIRENLWRIVGSSKDVLNNLPKGTQKGKIIWSSKFRINNRLADNLQKENCTLIGDAAHVHSPIGGRGMNLGVEDAFILSKLISENKQMNYQSIRRGYIKQTVRKINVITQVLTGDSFVSNIARKLLPMGAIAAPLFMNNARKFAMGLDK